MRCITDNLNGHGNRRRGLLHQGEATTRFEEKEWKTNKRKGEASTSLRNALPNEKTQMRLDRDKASSKEQREGGEKDTASSKIQGGGVERDTGFLSSTASVPPDEYAALKKCVVQIELYDRTTDRSLLLDRVP